MKARRRGAVAGSLTLLVLLAGCMAPPTIGDPNARIVPPQGVVPFRATVMVDDVGRSYIFHLPDGTDVTTDRPCLDVTVDRLEYTVTVECIRGALIKVQAVTAHGTNAAPTIRSVRINGDNERWFLRPFERTLIQPIVDYGGEWHLQSAQVSGDAYAYAYSVFYPPYEKGVCHAEWQGHLWDDAAIVYPMYASVTGESLPYSPTGLDEGYPWSYKNTNLFVFDLDAGASFAIPPQMGQLKVSIVDEFGRMTSRTFSIPILAGMFSPR